MLLHRERIFCPQEVVKNRLYGLERDDITLANTSISLHQHGSISKAEKRKTRSGFMIKVERKK